MRIVLDASAAVEAVMDDESRVHASVLTFDKRLKQLCNEMHIPLADA